MLVNDSFFTTAIEVSYFGGSSSKSFDFDREVIRQQRVEELLAFDVVKPDELISFKLPRANTFCNTLGKSELSPLISLSNLSLQLEVCSPSPLWQAEQPGLRP